MLLGIIVDISIIAIIGVSILFGYKKGLIGALLKILSFFIALILAFILYKPVAGYVINNTQIDDNIQITIEQAISAKENKGGEGESEEVNVQTNMPEVINNYVQEQVEGAAKTAQNEVAKVVSKNLTDAIIHGITLIGIFILTKFILLFIRIFADTIAKIPVIKQINKAGGTAYGVVRGFFIIYLVFAIISLISPMLQEASLLVAIESSFIGNMMYNNNLILGMFF